MMWRAIAVLVLTQWSATAAADPSAAHREALEASLTSLDAAVEDLRLRSQTEPAIVRPADAEALASDVAAIRSIAGSVPASDIPNLAEALEQDAALLQAGAGHADLNSAWYAVNLGSRNLDMISRATSDATGGSVKVDVAVFAIRNGARLPGYAVSAHRVGNPDNLHPFGGLTSAALPTASRDLIPGRYRFIAAKAGSRWEYFNEVPGGIATYVVEMPIE